MSAKPVSMHSGLFVQSRLPIVLHRVIPTGMISLHNIGMIEAAALANLAWLVFRAGLVPSFVPLDRAKDIALPMAVGAGLYFVAPP